jgi:hypothetical protein
MDSKMAGSFDTLTYRSSESEFSNDEFQIPRYLMRRAGIEPA